MIVSDVAGPQAYATEENSYLIPTLPITRKDGFATINMTACIEIMKRVYDESKTAAFNKAGINTSTQVPACCQCKRFTRQGRQARRDMQSLSPEHAVDKMVVRIKELVAERGWII